MFHPTNMRFHGVQRIKLYKANFTVKCFFISLFLLFGKTTSLLERETCWKTKFVHFRQLLIILAVSINDAGIFHFNTPIKSFWPKERFFISEPW